MLGLNNIRNCLERIEKKPQELYRVRMLSLLSAVITVGEYEMTREAISILKDEELDKKAVYETVLQSYLFLGFPRMIEAALAFNECYGDFKNQEPVMAVSDDESQRWFSDGVALCRRVYGRNYNRLEQRFLSVSPDLFRWMVFEGYGKVLSRNGMNNIERELAEVAALVVDKRERQLVSHILGSLNVGASMATIITVLDDIAPIAGDEATALGQRVLTGLKAKYEKEK